MNHFDTLIRGASLVLPGEIAVGDLGIRDGRIAALGDLSDRSAEHVVDARGLHVIPGVIDTQVHFREPGMEHKEDLASGSKAAVLGGVTTYFEMPNTNPTTTSAEALADKLARAAGRSYANYAFFVGASNDNIDELRELEMLPGSPGIKIFMGSSTGPLLVESDENLRRVLRNGQRRCAIHAEDEPRLRERKAAYGSEVKVSDHPHIRDAEAAALATRRILRLSAETGRPVHILHISTADELPLLAEAKSLGLGTTCEVTPQHLLMNDEWYERIGTKAQMNPPIRSEAHRLAISQALRDGLFDVFGSDHAPHTLEEKALPYPQSPSGMPGVQTLLPAVMTLVRDGVISLVRAVEMLSGSPARLYGIAERGSIAVGNWADLVLLDPTASFTVERDWLGSKCGWSPFEGQNLAGKPRIVWINGQTVIESDEAYVTPIGKMVSFLWKSLAHE